MLARLEALILLGGGSGGGDGPVVLARLADDELRVGGGGGLADWLRGAAGSGKPKWSPSCSSYVDGRSIEGRRAPLVFDLRKGGGGGGTLATTDSDEELDNDEVSIASDCCDEPLGGNVGLPLFI